MGATNCCLCRKTESTPRMPAAATGQAKLAKNRLRGNAGAHPHPSGHVSHSHLCAPGLLCAFMAMPFWVRVADYFFAGSALSGARRTVPKGTDGDT